MDSIVGSAPAIIGAITTPSFSVYWTRKNTQKLRGNIKGLNGSLEFIETAKFHKEWASIGDGAIAYKQGVSHNMTKGVKVALWCILAIFIILAIVGVISYYQTPST